MALQCRAILTGILLILFFQTGVASAGEEEIIRGRIAEGEQVIKKRACNICHSFNGVGGLIGPDLTQVGIRRTEDWLFRWMGDPSAVLPGTDMPIQPAQPWGSGSLRRRSKISKWRITAVTEQWRQRKQNIGESNDYKLLGAYSMDSRYNSDCNLNNLGIAVFC